MDKVEKIKKAVSEAVGILPNEQRIIVALKYEEELTFDEIASVLGQSVHEIRRTYIRAVTTCLDFRRLNRLMGP